jgi:RNA recognition motif-containing protein
MNSQIENNFKQANQIKDLEEGLENIILVEDDENVNKNLTKISSLTKNNTKNDEPQKKIEKIKTNLILYIGNLPSSIDNYELYELIQKNAKKNEEFSIDSMNIKKTQKDAAYAYVKFKTKKEVEAVKENLHLSTFKEKIIKADLFKKEEKRLINDINSNVFFKGFNKDINIQEVLKIFKEIGDVNSIKPKISTKGIFLGSGYVSYKDPESAADAILKLNNKEINNTRISVIKYNKYETRVLNRNFPVVLVQNLPPHIQNITDLNNLIIKFCETTLCGVYTVNKSEEMASTFNLQNMNFNSENEFVTNGIVLLPSTEEVEKCLINCNDPELNEYDIEITQAVCDKINCDRLIQAKKNSLKSKYEGCNIIVKNLPKNMDKKELTNLFSSFGPVKSVKIATEGVFKEIKDSRGIVMDKEYIYESKGLGYVLFLNVEAAKKCMSELHDVPYAFGDISLLLKMEYFNYDRIPGQEKEKNNDKNQNKKNENNLTNQKNYHNKNKGAQKFNNKKEQFNRFPQNNFNNKNVDNQNMPSNFPYGNNMGNPLENPSNNQELQGLGNIPGGNPRDMRMNPGNMDHNPYQNQNPHFMNVS